MSSGEGGSNPPKRWRLLKLIDQGPGRSRYQIPMPDLNRDGLHFSGHPSELHLKNPATGKTVPVDPVFFGNMLSGGALLGMLERFFRYPEAGHRVTGTIFPSPAKAKLADEPGALTVDTERLFLRAQPFEVDDSGDLPEATKWFLSQGHLEPGGFIVADVEGTNERFAYLSLDPSDLSSWTSSREPETELPALLATVRRLGGFFFTLPNIERYEEGLDLMPEFKEVLRELLPLIAPEEGRAPIEMDSKVRDLFPDYEESLRHKPALKPPRSPTESANEARDSP